MKRCSRCKKKMREECFYKDARTRLGLKSQCKPCHTEGNIRTRDPEKHKIATRESMRRTRKKDPEKYRLRDKLASRKRPKNEKTKARQILNNVLRSGKIIKPLGCGKCGLSVRLTAHHKDHSKPLEVEWLCYECHGNK